MAHGLNRKMFRYIFTIGFSVLCVLLTIVIHDVGRHFYLQHYTPVSRGVGLGFISFYFTFFIFPSFFIISFLHIRIGIVIALLIMSTMYFVWFGGNPLRVILMSASSIPSYVLLFYNNYNQGKKLK
jgi:hypothetical protein